VLSTLSHFFVIKVTVHWSSPRFSWTTFMVIFCAYYM